MKLVTIIHLPILGLALAVGLVESVSGQNLVSNPGFETSDFAGWTAIPASSGSGFGVGGVPHSGSYSAYFEGLGPDPDIISQDLITTPGATYQFSFWLDNFFGQNSSYLTASWNGDPELNLTPPQANFGWTQFGYSVTATGPSTTIEFAGLNLPGGIFLDDVSVVRVTTAESGLTAAMLGTAFTGLAFMRRKG